MERICATEAIYGSDDETHWAQWLWPHGGIDMERGFLVLERAVELDPGETDTVWASRCSQGYSCYNGIEHVVLRRSEIVVKFNERGRERLACGDLVVEFSLPDAAYNELVVVMQRVFDSLGLLTIES